MGTDGIPLFENDDKKLKCIQAVDVIQREPVELEIEEKITLSENDKMTPADVGILGDIIATV